MRASTRERIARRPSRRRQPAALKVHQPLSASSGAASSGHGVALGASRQAAPPAISPSSGGRQHVAARRARRRRGEAVGLVGQLGQQLGEEGGDLAARQQREQRARGRALLGVARDLEPQRREPEGTAQRALDDAHGMDAPHGHDRVGALQQPAADAQAVAVARDREAGERHDRADRRERPRRRPAARRPRAPSRPACRAAAATASSMSRSLEITLPNSWVAAASAGRTTPSWPAVSAPITRSRRPSRRSTSGSGCDRLGHLGPRRAHRRADPLDRLRADRLEHDLALRAAAGRLHVQRDDAEQALDRARHRVESLDAAERDRGRLRADDPASSSARPARRRGSWCCASAGSRSARRWRRRPRGRARCAAARPCRARGPRSRRRAG